MWVTFSLWHSTICRVDEVSFDDMLCLGHISAIPCWIQWPLLSSLLLSLFIIISSSILIVVVVVVVIVAIIIIIIIIMMMMVMKLHCKVKVNIIIIIVYYYYYYCILLLLLLLLSLFSLAQKTHQIRFIRKGGKVKIENKIWSAQKKRSELERRTALISVMPGGFRSRFSTRSAACHVRPRTHYEL